MNRDANTRKVVSSSVLVDLEGYGLIESDKVKFKDFSVGIW